MDLSELTHWPKLLPREKIQTRGVEQLSTPELLSTILGSGSRDVPVSQLADQIHQQFTFSTKVELADLLKIKGLGIAKSCQILAILELVERLRPSGYPLMDSLLKVLTQLGEIRYAQQERLICLYLNTRMQLILKETLAIGSANQINIRPSDIFGLIKHHPIHFLILAHNHPSGNPSPSAEDLLFTQRIAKAGQLLGVELLDHIIVGKEAHYSCKEQKII